MKKTPVAVQIGQAVWKSLFAFNFAISLIIFYPFFRIMLIRRKDYPRAFRVVKIWGWWLFLFAGIIPSVKREAAHIAGTGPALYCSNHTSFLDIMYAYILIPDYFVAMAKKELLKIPLFSIIVKRLNITVNRKNPMDAARAFVRAGEYLDQGTSVFLFPEGTISRKAPELNEFKNGAFALAIKKQVPVIPITFLNNWQLMQNGDYLRAHGRPGVARAVVHEAIDTEGMTLQDADALKTRVFTIINNELVKYHQLHSGADFRKNH